MSELNEQPKDQEPKDQKPRKKLSRTTVKRLRIGAIALILVVVVVSILVKINIHAPEKEGNKEEVIATINEEMAEADKLLQEVEQNKDRYSAQSIESFKSAMAEAKAILDNKDSTYEDLKDASDMLKKAIENIKGANDKAVSSSEELSSSETTSEEQSSSATANSGNSSNTGNAGNTGNTRNSGNSGSKGDSGNTGDTGNAGGSQGADTGGSKSVYITVNFTIECKILVGNPALKENKREYVPSNGIILGNTQVRLKQGQTVYDALRKICRAKGISYVTLDNGNYIRSINNLEEKDAGSLSGWKYSVNGTFPNWGCSSETCNDGDNIVWTYVLRP